ncbi:hypothetical protein RQM59_11250 [Flavobacteriaceae bacterium S356]|uniref:DUF3996 domain-containing protein n=1 Tax=Asprobacillus argus TaxID=3076534 RepID=A0ABU3LGW0_9FLAO|nr:hypothetical protein [Flavobacteriaceae bacterium S356]
MKSKNPVIVLLFLALITFNDGFSQETRERKNAVSFSLFGTSPILGITYERLLTNTISAEVGVGLIGLGAGVNYYPLGLKARKVNFYTGLKYSYIEDFILLNLDEQFYDSKVYIPIGINYLSPWNMNFGLDIGPAIVGNGFLGNVKIGFRF